MKVSTVCCGPGESGGGLPSVPHSISAAQSMNISTVSLCRRELWQFTAGSTQPWRCMTWFRRCHCWRWLPGSTVTRASCSRSCSQLLPLLVSVWLQPFTCVDTCGCGFSAVFLILVNLLGLEIDKVVDSFQVLSKRLMFISAFLM